ncbi:MAG: mycothiol system anti-sigma-R factor [Actinomycetota bacterium]|nr:mycothiol system anti-sigma-R factor [Actinomycetota bacterium]
MSCGEPHDTDCSEVIEAVYLYLDGELEHDGVDRIRQHLDECSPCLREYGIEREVKILVARSCCEAAPSSLRETVVERIRLVRTEMTVETSQEYRPD